MTGYTVTGPFSEILTMSKMPLNGPLADSELEVIRNAGVLMREDVIVKIGAFQEVLDRAQELNASVFEIDTPAVLMPGWIDPHTHICFAGSRASDYALRNSGATYLEIAASGGGIWDTVQKTRDGTKDVLKKTLIRRSLHLLHNGVTTAEVKSGYGLSVNEEMKMLEVINEADSELPIDLVPTCLAAHIVPKEYPDATSYLNQIINELFPVIRDRQLCNRVDAFIEEGAYQPDEIIPYLTAARDHGFDITIHADQFNTGGSRIAIEYGAVSADHLEVSGDKEIEMLAASKTIATVLPGASLGLGVGFAPARKILDAGGSLAIASDWNPGSAPMGDLLTSAAILGAYEKLNNAEVFAGMTFRAAAALRLDDRGKLEERCKADMIGFPCNDYREILYHQGQLPPQYVWKNGQLISS